AAQEAAAAARAAAQEAQAAVAALREAQAAGQGATAPARAASPTGTATTSSGTKASGADADAEKTPMSRTRKLIFWVVGAVVVAVALVLAARGLRTLEPVQEFIAAYDGNPSRPGEDPTGGYPWWMRWQHFLNMFLMVLIIRTGLQIRHEQRPPANFTPNAKGLFTAPGNTPKKFSLTMWMHQALDILWVVNGAIFVVLLFATGLWSRTIPTDPFVFHHALSAGIQYLSLDWPTGDKWVYYNALQMIAYTLVIFVAAPIAALTGWRMSSWWPTEAKGLNKAFPMEVARKVHFPTMIFFVIFIAIHLFLVAFTGVMKNLNYMYTGRDATDAWGLVVFLVSVAVTVAAWFLLRPAFVSPVASKFGTVGR
ncbi:MAG: cytochrome b/b6 domain-containing protein, partial [Micrococcus sp.]|nr:cytochrome b/b6 domain-containing protein [Micrococcus sp.]